MSLRWHALFCVSGIDMKSAVKLLSETEDVAVVGGYGVVFGGVDLEGETFTKDTDYQLDLVPAKPVYYDHSHNAKVQHSLGTVKAIDPRDDGLWIEAELDKSRQYADAVLALIGEGVLGWSSGSVAHLTRRDGKTIKQWPIIEFSLTATPAEPRTIGVERIKTLVDQHPELKALLEVDEEIHDADAMPDDAQPGEPANPESIGEFEMSEDVKNTDGIVTRDEFDRFADEMKDSLKGVETANEAINLILRKLEQAEPVKTGGYVAPGAGDDDAHVKSFADFLMAVQKNDTKRLHGVYGAQKDMSSVTGGSGGYLVPDEFSANLLQVIGDGSEILRRVFSQPVTTQAGRYPILDTFVAPTAGSGHTALSGGLSPAGVAEGAAYGEDQPTFEMLEWRIKKVGEIVDVPAELIADSGTPIENLLTRLFSVAIESKLERDVIRGAGVGGEMLGILNSAAAIAVTPATNNAFGEADALSMFSRFKQIGGGNPVWLMHRGVIPDFLNFTSSGQDLVEWRMQVPTNLLGFPVIFSEHMPQDDNSGNVILADLGAYIMFDRQQLVVASSEHAKFENDLVVWKYSVRVDGMPWMKAPITLADPQGSYTVSPFVYHND